MNKLKQIEALVEEVFIQLGIVTRNAKEKKILVDFGRKCAEIDEEDWEESSHAWIGDTIKEYNTRLRGDEKEEVKQEETMADKFREYLKTTPREQLQKDWDEVLSTYNDRPIKREPALQPLPDEVPEWFITPWKSTLGDITMRVEEWHKILDHFGTQPREWWMDLKKGDKFMYGKNAYELDAILLRTVNDYTYNIDNCSPYTDPEAQLRKTLNPEQIKLLDEMKANTKV